MTHRGLIDLDQLRVLVDAGKIDTVLVMFTDLYGRFVGKRYDAEFFLADTVAHGSHACDYLLTVDMELDTVQGYEFSSWEKGYGDVHLVPDLATLRVASWLDRSAIVLCDVHDVKTDEPVALAPRSMLKAQVARAARLGFEVAMASELEYYLFRTSYRQAAEQGYANLEPYGWYLEDYQMLQGTREEPFNAAARRHLRDSGIPVENSKGEWGLGQHELNVRYSDAVTMADRHALYKQCMREIADQQGSSVSFMAKPYADRAGSSCHIHLSLWKGGENAFAGDLREGPVKCSETFRHFLGGWIEHAAESMVFYAPTVNSYKRYRAGSWAPTRLAWSHDNRTGGFRVVGSGKSLRIECRIPGADANPYLAFAAALASGLDGIEKRTEPPAMFEGDMYKAQEIATVPATLAAACDVFEKSEFAAVAYGAPVARHYRRFFRAELEAWDAAVTDWERRRYFERI